MTIANYPHSVTDRFLRYVRIDTQSDPDATCFPSTEKQKDLARLLVQELKQIGITDAEMDAHGYVFATIPATTDKQVPVLCFCAHMDTAPDCSGTNVKPIIHHNWNGDDIVMPDDPAVILSKNDHPYLHEKIGEDLITASGTTLLGADDKAGVAIIMDLAQYLIQNPQIKHGKIRILFTPDEEVGRGTEKLDMQKLGADFGYTLDGGERGCLEGETFSADQVTAIFHGISMHPGEAKGHMINAVKAASHFVDLLPRHEWSPETTEDQQGFVHPTDISGSAEKAEVKFIIRDFDTNMLAAHEQRLQQLQEKTKAAFPGLKTEFIVHEQYRNMREVLDQHPQVMDYAETAYARAGITARRLSIRGGTDGSRLSFMGLPCPNLFTGEMALHSKVEYVSIQDMQKSVAMLAELVQVWEENS